MDRRITLGLLVTLIVAHIGLALAFASETPYRASGVLLSFRRSPQMDIGAPDERQHVNYVAHLADGQGFPVFNPKDPNLYETYQSHQPPAFYVLETAWSKLMGVSDFSASDAGVKLRSLNALIGAITVAGVYYLLLWGFDSEGIALVGASFCALLPMFVALSGAVSNDPLLLCLCTWTLALLTKCLTDGWTWKLAIGIGVLTGIALLTKTTALALAPVLLISLFLPKAQKPTAAMFGATAALALIIVAPWWVRNQNLYQDPVAMKAFSQAFQGSAQKEGIIATIKAEDADANAEITYWKDWVGWWTARSFFGVFGYMDIWLNERGTWGTGPSAPNTLYRLLMAGSFLCAVGWLASLREAEAKNRVIAHSLNAVFFVVVLLLFLKFNNQYFQAQARYLLPAIGPIAGAFAVGLFTLMRGRTYAALALVVIIMAGIDVYALTRLPGEFQRRTSDLEPAAFGQNHRELGGAWTAVDKTEA